MKQIVHCKVIRNVYTNTDGTFSIYGCVPSIDDEDKVKLTKYGNFTLKGDLSLLEVGGEYTIEIEEKTGNYGYEYWLVGFPEIEDFDIGEVKDITDSQEAEMLKTFMTPSQARYVHEAYPNFIRLVLEGNESEIDYNKIHNVAQIRLQGYINKINQRFKYYRVHLDYPDYELNFSECGALCAEYKSLEGIHKALEQNPYKVLIEVLDRGFNEADRQICDIDSKWKDSKERCLYLACYLLECNEEDGNTRINGNELAQVIAQYSPRLNDHIVDLARNSGLIYFDEKTKDLSLMGTYLAECHIAEEVKNRTTNVHKWDIDTGKYHSNDMITLTEEQGKLLDLVCDYDMCMLIGSAGSGKSSSVKALIDLLDDNDKTYTLLAPSGIAAKRLREATGREASTIHKRLASGGMIENDVLVIDEVSMVDVRLFSSLLNCTSENTKVVLVFDSAQLASISCGNLVQDLMDSHKLPYAQLTKVFRYGIGGIATVGTDARYGREYLKADGSLNCENANKIKDYKFIQVGDEPLAQLMDEYAKLRKKYAPKDILILTPYNKGSFGTYAINEAIQRKYNPPKRTDNFTSRKLPKSLGTPVEELEYHIGDKVINKKNNYHALTKEGFEHWLKATRLSEEIDRKKVNLGGNCEEVLTLEDELIELNSDAPDEATIYNGDIGFIKDITPQGHIYVQFDEQMIVFRKSDLQNLLLAYACTSHASQGCESKAVIFLTHPSQKRMLSRNLCYMSLTRAKELLVEIGDIGTINHALTINETTLRNTWLKDLLTEKEENNANGRKAEVN